MRSLFPEGPDPAEIIGQVIQSKLYSMVNRHYQLRLHKTISWGGQLLAHNLKLCRVTAFGNNVPIKA